MSKYPIEKYKFVFYDETKEDGTQVKVICAITTYCGKTVKGYAKCDPRDEYSREFGKALAASRCNEKVAIRRARRMYLKAVEAENLARKAKAEFEKMKKYTIEAEQDASIATCEREVLELETLK